MQHALKKFGESLKQSWIRRNCLGPSVILDIDLTSTSYLETSQSSSRFRNFECAAFLNKKKEEQFSEKGDQAFLGV